MRSVIIVVPLLLLAMTGCAEHYNQKNLSMVQRQAAWDLACPENQLQAQPLQTFENGGPMSTSTGIVTSWGVRGCGQQATYAWVDGSWVITARRPLQQYPMMPPPGAPGAAPYGVAPYGAPAAAPAPAPAPGSSQPMTAPGTPSVGI